MRILILLALVILSGVAVAESQNSILVAANGSIRGPFTHEEALAPGESKVILTVEQFAALDALRKASPGARLVWNGASFSLHPIEQLRAALLAEFGALSPGEQELFRPQLEAVRRLLIAGQVSEARKVIELSGFGMPQSLTDLRGRLLALFPQ
jgi:hypothetical protein